MASGTEGSSVTQLKDELKSLSSDQCQHLISELEFKIEISAAKSLALKSNLYLPWKVLQKERTSYLVKYITVQVAGRCRG